MIDCYSESCDEVIKKCMRTSVQLRQQKCIYTLNETIVRCALKSRFAPKSKLCDNVIFFGLKNAFSTEYWSRNHFDFTFFFKKRTMILGHARIQETYSIFFIVLLWIGILGMVLILLCFCVVVFLSSFVDIETHIMKSDEKKMKAKQ